MQPSSLKTLTGKNVLEKIISDMQPLWIGTVTLVLTLGGSKKDVLSRGSVERKSVLESRTVSLKNLT